MSSILGEAPMILSGSDSVPYTTDGRIRLPFEVVEESPLFEGLPVSLLLFVFIVRSFELFSSWH